LSFCKREHTSQPQKHESKEVSAKEHGEEEKEEISSTTDKNKFPDDVW